MLINAFPQPIKASGDYVVEEITKSGTWTVPTGVTEIEVRLFGGGGSGQYSGGGGGGGGHMAYRRIKVAQGETYTVAIGAGGASRTGNSNAGKPGGATAFGNLLTANGGEGGGQRKSGCGGNGGAGGGGSVEGGNGSYGGGGGGSSKGELAPALGGVFGGRGGTASDAAYYGLESFPGVSTDGSGLGAGGGGFRADGGGGDVYDSAVRGGGGGGGWNEGKGGSGVWYNGIDHGGGGGGYGSIKLAGDGKAGKNNAGGGGGYGYGAGGGAGSIQYNADGASGKGAPGICIIRYKRP